jgi:hypothetical protein
MLKRCGISDISLLSAALDWCKNTAGRYWRSVRGIAWSTTACCQHDQFEERRSTKVGHPVQIESRGERLELSEFTKVMNIGDRIRVVCDDGVLVAEKVSQTQFKLIHAQEASELVR